MKWKNAAQAPVLFFVDDLCNSYVTPERWNGKYLESDYGHFGNQPFSAVSFLRQEILSHFPEIKTTFFAVAGPLNPDAESHQTKRISYALSHNDESTNFFSKIATDPMFELAYHGYFHNMPNSGQEKYIPEWLTYSGVEEGLQTISKGKNIFESVTGQFPKGGKYPAYQSNEFSDTIIENAGFKWWCRSYNRGNFGKKNFSVWLDSKRMKREFNVQFFGKKNVVDIPTSFSGSMFQKYPEERKWFKSILKKRLFPQPLEEIAYFLKNGLIISLNEHISPIRIDGIRQMPNIFDDRESQLRVFEYLRDKNVWYCTASELAEWVINKK
jgi:hypothetical protein